MKKIHARQSTLKKTFMLWPKKIHTRNFVTKKNSRRSKTSLSPTPPPPITFLMVRPLIWGEGKVKQFS